MVANAKQDVVEIEVRSDNGNKLYFSPTGKSLRGYIDFATVKSRIAQQCRDRFPEPVPGKIIGINRMTGEKYIREPLYDPEHSTVRKRVEKMHALDLQRESIDSESEVTWLYWMRRAVDGGLARIVQGELPDRYSFPGEERPTESKDGKPRKNFIIDQEESQAAKFATALNSMADAINANTAVLGKLLERLDAKK